MPFVPKESKKKRPSSYKTLYMAQELIDQINEIARVNDMSFNGVVVSMIEHCLADRPDEQDS